MRGLLPLVILYLALDFANPLMPGAVGFEEGAVEGLRAERVARAVRPEAPPPRVGAPIGAPRPVAADVLLGRPAPRPGGVPARAGRPVRRRPPRRFPPSPPPSEDH